MQPHALALKTEVVYELDLHGRKLTQIQNIERPKSLRVLDLSCNCLSKIEGLSCNQDLRELKLYSNALEVIEGLERLVELRSLQLQHNRISSIGKGLTGQSRLRVLRLDHNHLIYVGARELCLCPLLSQLNLSHNYLASVEGLDCLLELEELQLAANHLTVLPDLGRCKKLLELDISENPLPNSFLVALESLQQLKILRIEGLHIKEAIALPRLRCLEELHMARNELQSLEGVPELFPTLELLGVSHNLLPTVHSLNCLHHLSSITELLVEGNPLCSVATSYRSEVKTVLPLLEVLDGVPFSVAMVGSAPLMRPLTPASLGPSMRQVEQQLWEAGLQLDSCQSHLRARFEMVGTAIDSLAHPPPGTAAGLKSRAMPSDIRPCSRSSSRARLQEALAFATEHFDTAEKDRTLSEL